MDDPGPSEDQVKPSGDKPSGDKRRRVLRTEAWFFLEILGLCAFVFARPVLDVLGNAPEVFVLRGLIRRQVTEFLAMVVLAPATAIWIVTMTSRAISRKTRAKAHALAVAVLAGLGVWQILRLYFSLNTAFQILGATVVGVATYLVRTKSVSLRRFLRGLAILAPLVSWNFAYASPSSVLFESNSSASSTSSLAQTPDVLFIVFDELGTSTLFNGTSSIDPNYFPNFARLASRATLFDHASTLSTETLRSVPAILTSQEPAREDPTEAANSPEQSLFTLLGDSYALNDHELVTQVCPSDMCKEQFKIDGAFASLLELAKTVFTNSLVDKEVAQSKTNSLNGEIDEHRLARIDRFIESLETTQIKPRLDFAHMLIPHGIYSYTPEGIEYFSGVDGSSFEGFISKQAAATAQHRHFLQTMFADKVLGRALDVLDRLGRFDKTMIVVTADHGSAFDPEHPYRGLDEQNLKDVAMVPLLIKFPNQSQPSVRTDAALNIDAVATIAALTGAEASLPLAGRDLRKVDPSTQRHILDTVIKDESGNGREFEFDADFVFDQILFTPAVVDSSLEKGLYTRGDYADLFGRKISEFQVEPPTGIKLQVPLKSAIETGDSKQAPLEMRSRVETEAQPYYLRAILERRWVSLYKLDGFGVAFALDDRIACASVLEPVFFQKLYDSYCMADPAYFSPKGNRLTVYLIERTDQGTTFFPVDVE